MSLQSNMGPLGSAHFFFVAFTSLHCDTIDRPCDMVCVCFIPAFTGIRCTYSYMDGEAELTQVAGYTQKWFTCQYYALNS